MGDFGGLSGRDRLHWSKSAALRRRRAGPSDDSRRRRRSGQGALVTDPKPRAAADNDPASRPSIWDGDESAENTPWFAPPLDEVDDDLDPWAPPLPQADRRPIFDPKDWLKAAHAVPNELARAAAALARLEARLAYDPRAAPFARRLAFEEVAGLLWLQGDHGSIDDLALYDLGVRAASGPRDFFAAWALRRLRATTAFEPERISVAELRDFVGARVTEPDEESRDLFERPLGPDFDDALEDWREFARALESAHPLIKSAALFAAWRALILSEPTDMLTPLVIAGRVGAGPQRSALGFAPIARAARRRGAVLGGGSTETRLASWLDAVTDSCLEAALDLDRFAVWRERAEAAACSSKAGKALVSLCSASPVVSSNFIAEHAGMTPQAINGAARALLKANLIKEVTGLARYRLWAARL